MLSKEVFEKKLEGLEEWFKDNPKLPSEINRLLLIRFLKCMNGNVEETQKLIEHNYTMRNKNPQLFIARDPEEDCVKVVRDATDLVVLPGLTPDRQKIILFRISNTDPRLVNSVVEARIFFMIADCRFVMRDVDPEMLESSESTLGAELQNENDEQLDAHMADGDIQIVDIGGFSMGHIARLSLLTMRVYMKFLQEAFPVRVRAVHIINCPSYLDKMVALVRPFVRDDVYKMVHFHTNGLDSLYECVPRDMLPDEYGGKAGSITDLKAQLTKILEEKKEYLMDSKQWKVDEAKKSRWNWF